MASISSPSLIRFLAFRNPKILHTPPLPFPRYSKAHVAGLNRLSAHVYYLHPPLRSPVPIRSWVPVPHPSLRFLLGVCSRPLRSAMSSMTNPQASSDSPQSVSTKTERVVIKGRVQGVFYRNWTIENANQLGLKGWVRNRRDGSVEALFSGPPEAIQEMEQRCRRGPRDAIVTDLQVFPSEEDPGTGFGRKPTI